MADSTLRSTPVEGVRKMTDIERAANAAGVTLDALGWNALLGLTAVVDNLADLSRLVHVLDVELDEIKLGGEVGRTSYRTRVVFDGTELTIHTQHA